MESIVEQIKELNVSLEMKAKEHQDAEMEQWVHDIDWMIRETKADEVENTAYSEGYSAGESQGYDVGFAEGLRTGRAEGGDL